MNTGTNTPLSIDHDVTGDGTSSVISATNMNDIIINGIPVIFAFEIKFVLLYQILIWNFGRKELMIFFGLLIKKWEKF